MRKEKVFYDIVDAIKNSKKYKSIYKKTIERIVENILDKHSTKDVEKKAKNILHQDWGAFYKARTDFKKIIQKVNSEIRDGSLARSTIAGGGVKEILKPILAIHNSTKERLNILENFYKEIFNITGKPNSILDIGCGFNPLCIPWMNLLESTKYKSIDIDEEEIAFLREIFHILKININIEFEVKDILIDKFEFADCIFLLKIIPILERTNKDITEILLNKLKYNHLVVSFPTKSLSSKEKGMEKFYSENFEALIHNNKFHKLNFLSELVYIVIKKTHTQQAR